MTYKEIINRFRTVTEEHLMLQDFGYGQLSDLKTQSQLGPEEQGADYPYLFLLPATSNRQGPVMNYSFNMVVMDMARGEEGDQYDNYITIQSQCQQYIDDVLARLYYYYKDQPDINLTNISYTPFKEKYQDDLAGMTATITISVPTPINECIAPFAPYVPPGPPAGELLFDWSNSSQYTIFPNFTTTNYFLYNVMNYDPVPYWQSVRIKPILPPGNYKLVINQNISLNAGPPTAVVAAEPVIRPEGVGSNILAATSSGWPTTYVNESTIYTYQAEYIFEVVEGAIPAGGWYIIVLDTPGFTDHNITVKPGGNIKLYTA